MSVLNEETKQYIAMHLSVLKNVMSDEKLIFGIVVDRKDVNESKLAIIDREKYLKTGIADGFFVSLSDLNKGLLEREE